LGERGRCLLDKTAHSLGELFSLPLLFLYGDKIELENLWGLAKPSDPGGPEN
jgi:hypothetical protein